MTRVLFVDDESRVLGGLRRALWARRSEWDMAFEESGDAALHRIDEAPVDVIVTDFRMPGMDGGQFLHEARLRHPGSARLVLSGHTEERDLYGLVGLAHQFLVKPCPPDHLARVVEGVLDARGSFPDVPMRAAVSALESLPCAPQALVELEQALNTSPPHSNGPVAAALEADVGLAAKVLQLVNSSFFAPAARITSLEEAAGRLGPTTLRALAYGLARASRHTLVDLNWLEQLNDHALAAARRARLAAPAVPGAADDAFCAGLLNSVGRLAMAACAAQLDPCTTAVDPADAGAYLLQLWGLPTDIVAAATNRLPEYAECAV